jgi:hypothetical protein
LALGSSERTAGGVREKTVDALTYIKGNSLRWDERKYKDLRDIA